MGAALIDEQTRRTKKGCRTKSSVEGQKEETTSHLMRKS